MNRDREEINLKNMRLNKKMIKLTPQTNTAEYLAGYIGRVARLVEMYRRGAAEERASQKLAGERFAESVRIHPQEVSVCLFYHPEVLEVGRR